MNSVVGNQVCGQACAPVADITSTMPWQHPRGRGWGQRGAEGLGGPENLLEAQET